MGNFLADISTDNAVWLTATPGPLSFDEDVGVIVGVEWDLVQLSQTWSCPTI